MQTGQPDSKVPVQGVGDSEVLEALAKNGAARFQAENFTPGSFPKGRPLPFSPKKRSPGTSAAARSTDAAHFGLIASLEPGPDVGHHHRRVRPIVGPDSHAADSLLRTELAFDRARMHLARSNGLQFSD